MYAQVVFRYVALTAAVCALVFGFQNCADDPAGPPEGGSVMKPIVSQLCENVEDKTSCLTRAKCLHSSDQECNTPAAFSNTLPLDTVAPVMVYPSETMSLWASLEKENVTYQWYKNSSFYKYGNAGSAQEQAGKTNKYFELPACPTLAADTKSVLYYYAQASYDSVNLQAPFLVACDISRVSV